MSEQKIEQEFIVTARKWRPLRFDTVVGQEHITHTLQNAIKNNRLHHAYLFCGPRGVGKTTTARILARAVNCLNPINDEPCNACANCISAIDSRSMDVIEIDGASNNSVDDVRKLRENAKYPPSSGKYKMYIIDEVHMLSTSAFNALLKTLEEPPPHLIFVFATTESHKVPATIISRCQRFDFRRMELESIVKQIKYIAEKENFTIDEESLVAIAKKGDGSMRDSQSIFDQVIAFCGTNVTYSQMADALHLIDEEFFFRISNAIINKDASQAFAIAAEVMEKGYELTETLQGLLEHFRNLLSVKVTGSTSLIESSQAYLIKYTETAEKLTKADLMRYLQITMQTEHSLKFAQQPRIKFELALVQMATMDKAQEISELISELRSMKNLPPSQMMSNPASARDTSATYAAVEKKNDIVAKQVVENLPRAATKLQAAESVTAKPVELSSSNLPAEDDIPLPEQDNYSHNFQQEDLTEKQPKSLDTDADSLKKNWGKFLDFATSKDISLNILREANPNFFNNEIMLSTKNSFAASSANKKINQINDLLIEFFGKSIEIKIATDTQTQSSNQNSSLQEGNFAATKSSNEITAREFKREPIDAEKLKDKHPIEVRLITEFGAVEVN